MTPPEKERANEAVLELLAAALGISTGVHNQHWWTSSIAYRQKRSS